MAVLTGEGAVDESSAQNTHRSKEILFFFLFGMPTSPPARMEQLQLSLSIG